MKKVNEAKNEKVWVIMDNGFPEQTNLYDWVMKFEDEDKLIATHDEEPEQDEAGNWYDANNEWKVVLKRVNRSSQFVETFDSEEEAEDFCFDRIFNYDFQNANEDTGYYDSEKEAEEVIVERLSSVLYIDLEVAKNIYRKSKIVFDIRQKRDAEHKAKITAEHEARKVWLSVEVPKEAASITIDEDFKAAIKWASEATGNEKSNRMASALKGLLARNGKDKIETDFWQVLRILKSQTLIKPVKHYYYEKETY